MRSIDHVPNAFTGTVYNQPLPARCSSRSKQEKKDYGTQRCCNSFLKVIVPPIAPRAVTRDWLGEPRNYITKENYDYLLASVQNYASLLGIKLEHNPGNSIGEGISNMYDELDDMIGEINLNMETHEEKLQFVLWKYHTWDDYTFYWLPVKFMESLSPRLRRLTHSFIHQFTRDNGLLTTNESFDINGLLEWMTDELDEQDEYDSRDKKERASLFGSYERGKIWRLMERLSTKTYYKNLLAALERYAPNNKCERELVDLLKEGLQFIGENNPSIIWYTYDPLYDEERDYEPVEMDRMIRIVYDLKDIVTKELMCWINNELREAYDISPVSCLFITPDTSEPFRMDDYPERLCGWFNKMCTLIEDNYE